MIVWIAFFLLFTGLVCGVFTGNTEAICRGMLDAPYECVTLILKIGGAICFFSGLMKVAEGSGLVGGFSRFIAPPIGFLVPQTRNNPLLQSSVTMNLASNFFGLGNAATPYGIKACREMDSGVVSRSLSAFVLLNTCSVQLIPTTVLALRSGGGAQKAGDILPAVWVVQIVVCTFALILTRLFFREVK